MYAENLKNVLNCPVIKPRQGEKMKKRNVKIILMLIMILAFSTSLMAANGVTFGSEHVFNAAAIDYMSSSDLSETQFINAYRDYGNSQSGTVCIGTVSGNSISYGSEYVFQSGRSGINAIKVLDPTHFVIVYSVYQQSITTNYAKVGTIGASDVITFGAAYPFREGYANYLSLDKINATTFVMSYLKGSDDEAVSVIAEVSSGDVVSFGSEYVFNNADIYGASTAVLDASTFVIAYKDQDPSSQHAKAIVGVVSGNVVTFGTESIFNNGFTNMIGVTPLDATHCVIAFRDGENTDDGTALVATISGNTLSFGSKYIFHYDGIDYLDIQAFDASSFVITFRDYGNDIIGAGTAVAGAAVGNVLSFGPPSVYNLGDSYYNSIAKLNSTDFAVTYRDAGNSNYGTSVVGTISPVPGNPILKTTTATFITSSTVETGGKIVWGGANPITESGVCWSTIPTPTTSDNTLLNGAVNGTFTSSVTGLNPETTYYVRAYAINSDGIGYGDEISFATKSILPVVTTDDISYVGDTFASSGGEVTWEGDSSVVARGVCWSTSTNPTIADDVTTDGSGTGTFSSEVTGLIPETTYYIRAYATNTQGTSYGEEKTIQTAPAAIVWDGPTIEISKADYADWTLPENQDRITDYTWLTRGNSQGLFNIKTESAFDEDDYTSPANTEWAFGDLADYATLSYMNWADLGWTIGGAPDLIGMDVVVHLITENIYFSYDLQSWTSGAGSGGGGFSYIRSTAGGATSDYPSGEGTDVGGGTTILPTENLNDAVDQTIPPFPNGNFTADYQNVFSGTGIIDITFTTPYAYGAFYQSGVWNSVMNSGGTILFENINFDLRGDIPIILGDDNPLPVTLSSFSGTFIDGSSILSWSTQSEANNLGWNVFRSETEEITSGLQINAEMIEGAGTTTEQTDYTFADQTYHNYRLFY